MQILAAKWTADGWLVVLDGQGVENARHGDRLIVPFAARPDLHKASMRVEIPGPFPVARLDGLHNDISAQALIGEEVTHGRTTNGG